MAHLAAAMAASTLALVLDLALAQALANQCVSPRVIKRSLHQLCSDDVLPYLCVAECAATARLQLLPLCLVHRLSRQLRPDCVDSTGAAAPRRHLALVMRQLPPARQPAHSCLVPRTTHHAPPPSRTPPPGWARAHAYMKWASACTHTNAEVQPRPLDTYSRLSGSEPCQIP